MKVSDWLRAKVTEYTPGVGRVFVVCGAAGHPGCNRVVPYYYLYGRGLKQLGCRKCGNLYVRVALIPEWKAALWLAWAWVTRKGDPRMPLREAESKYA